MKKFTSLKLFQNPISGKCRPNANNTLAINETVGRNERDEVKSSIEMVAAIAKALEVFLDYLAGNLKKAAVDKKTLKLIHDIEDLEPSVKDKLIFLANAVIRDSKTGKAYAH